MPNQSDYEILFGENDQSTSLNKQLQQKQDFSNDLNQVVYLYRLERFLSPVPTKDGLDVSPTRSTILTVNTSDYLEMKVARIDNELDFGLGVINDPSNPENLMLKKIETISFKTQYAQEGTFGSGLSDRCKTFIDSDFLYIISYKQLDESNFNEVDKIIVTDIKMPNSPIDQILHFYFTTNDLEDYLSNFKVKPFIIIPTTKDFAGKKVSRISFKSPKGTFLSAIKAFAQDEYRIPVFADESTYINYKYIFPYQISPTMEVMDWWASETIIGFKDMFDFLNQENINYNESFSLSKFLELGKVLPPEEVTVGQATTIEFELGKGYRRVTWNTKTGAITSEENQNYEPREGLAAGDSEVTVKKARFVTASEIDNSNIKEKQRTFYAKTPVEPTQWSFESSPFDLSFSTYYPYEMKNLRYITKSSSSKSELYQLVIDMLNFSFHAKQNFKGATKYDPEEQNFVVDNEEIYKLYEEAQAAGGALEAITNRFDAWIQQHPQENIQNQEYITRAKWVLGALSNDIISNYSYNKANNDDYKLALPFYLEIQNGPTNTTDPKPYGSIEVKLKSSFGYFTEDDFIWNKPTISKNPTFTLSKNVVTFPEPSQSSEVTSIPSTNPADVNLSNGEYSKFLVKKITKTKSYINSYGSGEVALSRLDDIACDGTLVFENNAAYNLKTLSIGGLYINGTWQFEFTIEDDVVNFEMFLGNNENDALSLYLLNL